MSHQPRIEEVSDSDSDPPDMDPSEFAPMTQTLATRPAPGAGAANTMASGVPAGGIPVMNKSAESQERLRQQRAMIKRWHCLYPVYFDAGRTRAQGRRVSKNQAVQNPLAGEIAEAVRQLGMQPFVEMGKMHPKDWANPGRVRVKLKDEDGSWSMSKTSNNKHHLYLQVAEYLQKHPTTEETPLKLPVQGLPNPKVVPPAVPRGWKMSSILPLHSPAVTGGGVSENMIKDMMAEMQGEGGAGMPALPPGMAGMANMLGAGGPSGGGGSSGVSSEKKAKKDKKKGKG